MKKEIERIAKVTIIGLMRTCTLHISTSFFLRSFSLEQNSTPKVVMLGNVGVGKSSLACRFAYDQFKDTTESTIGKMYIGIPVIL